MQGIFINGSRPKSKKQVKEYVDGIYNQDAPEDPYGLVIEATSMFGNEFDGSFHRLQQTFPEGCGTIYFVGPNPHQSRKFYGTIRYNAKKARYVVA